MSEHHITESTGAFVLGALTAEEAQQIEAHAQECEECRRDIRALKEVTSVLPLASPVVEPPPDLKGKVIAAARGDEPAHQALRRAVARAAQNQPQHDFWHRPVSSWAGIAGWAGVVAALVTGIFIGVASEHQLMISSLQPAAVNAIRTVGAAQNIAGPEAKVFAVNADQLQSQAIALIGQSQVFDLSVRHNGDRIPAKIMQMPNQNSAVLVSDMPVAPAGEVYRVWLIRKGKMHLGSVVGAGNMIKTMIPMKVKMGDVIAFSMAPIGDNAMPSHFMMQQTL